jgi:hypothetical protein
MRFRISKATSKYHLMIFDEDSRLITKKEVQMRHSIYNSEDRFGFEHSPENDFHLVEYSNGQYSRLMEVGLYDIYLDSEKWNDVSPIFYPDVNEFQYGDYIFTAYGWFGDGSDGSYSLGEGQGAVSGLLQLDEGYNYRLLRDGFFENLTIQSDATLHTDGYRIFCTGTLNVLGTIDYSGNDGMNGGDASDGLGGSGGSGGVAVTGGYFPSMGKGGDGGAGKSCPNVSASYNGEQGTVGGNGSAGAYAIGDGVAQYGTSGQGGYVEGYPPAPAGVNSGSPTATLLANSAGTTRKLFTAYLGRVIDGNGLSVRQYCSRQGNAGGGGGGTGTFHASSSPLSPPAFAGSGGGGGGAGSDGGTIGIYARIISGNGVIKSEGGIGGNGGNGSDGKRDETYFTGAGGGGGGMGGNGGNGGLIYIVSNSYQFTGDTSVSGGEGGLGGDGGNPVSYGITAYAGSKGADGTNGYSGYIIRFGVT